MSDFQQGPGWWQASDGKWYPPEAHPQFAPPPPPPAGPMPPPPYPGPPPVAKAGNGLATAGFVCGLIALLCGLTVLGFFLAWLLGVLGLVFGVIGRNRVKAEPTLPGQGLATAGVVLGVIAIVLGFGDLALINHASHRVRTDLRAFNSSFESSLNSDRSSFQSSLDSNRSSFSSSLESHRVHPGDFTVSVDLCKAVSEFGTSAELKSTGSVTNSTTYRKDSVTVNVDFKNAAGAFVGKGSGYVGPMDGGATASFEAKTVETGETLDGLTCTATVS